MQINIDGANRTVITLNNGTRLYISYKTCVAASIPNDGIYRTDKVWSRTTSKMIGEWGLTARPKKPQEFFDSLLASV